MTKRKYLFPLLGLVVLLGCLVSLVDTFAQPDGASFAPPNRKARLAAIGSLKSVPRDVRAVFVPGDDFDPIPNPGPSDWLAQHAEPGQTFAQFMRGRPHRPDRRRNRIYFLPLGDFDDPDAPDLKSMETFAGAFFGMETSILPARPLDGLPIKQRKRAHGPQLLSTDVLKLLQGEIPDDAYCMIALTMRDLYPKESWNFVFGQASLRDRVGVYSFARYLPSFEGKAADESTKSLVMLRSCKVLAHETGHMFGIRHCVHFHCLMNGSNHADESDAAPIHLCPVCLRKLHSSVHFDIADRYEQLQSFSEKMNWNEEAEWLADRIQTTELRLSQP